MRKVMAVIVAVAALLTVSSCSDDSTGAADLGDTAAVPADPGKAAEDFAKVEASTNVDAKRYLYPTTTGSRDDDQNWGDLFLPPGEYRDGEVSLVVLIHGGAWKSEIGADSFVTFARRLAERGLAVYNVEYRRVGAGGGWPTTFADVAAALDYIPNIKKSVPSLNTDNVVVAGHSAGGQLAMWAGTRHRLKNDEVGSKPKFQPGQVISLSGPIDMTTAVRMGDNNIVEALSGTPDEVPERYAEVDPIQNIDPGMPVIAMNGDKDRVVPAVLSRNYVSAAKAAGGKAALVILPGINHVQIVDPRNPQFTTVLETISRAAHDSARQ